MTRQGFVEGLGRSLTGKLDAGRVSEITKYYEDYIMIEMRKGRSEEAVLKELGDPRLIAKSILAAESKEDNHTSIHSEAEDADSYGTEESFFSKFKKLPTWLKAIIIGCVIVLILSIIFKIIAFFIPIIIPILLIVWVVRFLKDK